MNQQSLPGDEFEETPLDLIKKLGAILVDVDKDIKEKEETLSQVKAKRKQIAEVMLPELMEDIDIESLTLADGTKITLSKFYNAKIPEAHWGDAVEWLESKNHDGIIKSGFTVALSKGQTDLGHAAKAALRELGIPVIVKDSIHPSTLRAFVKEQLEQGEDIPKEMFGVYEGKRVTFK